MRISPHESMLAMRSSTPIQNNDNIHSGMQGKRQSR